KYGRIETRDVGEESNEVNFTYYTHYTLSLISSLRYAKFNLSIDEDIADDVKEVKAVSGSKEIKAKKLSDGTYSFDHNDVLSRSLIGVNQQFDIKVVFNDDVDQTIKDDYKV